MTQVELAQRSGIPQTTISKYECARVSLRIDRLEQLAAALEVPLTALFEQNDRQPPCNAA